LAIGRQAIAGRIDAFEDDAARPIRPDSEALADA
jgi:hypothetical protein